jgi:hypothetical protein
VLEHVELRVNSQTVRFGIAFGISKAATPPIPPGGRSVLRLTTGFYLAIKF